MEYLHPQVRNAGMTQGRPMSLNPHPHFRGGTTTYQDIQLLPEELPADTEGSLMGGGRCFSVFPNMAGCTSSE